jgi:hypothetical protein
MVFEEKNDLDKSLDNIIEKVIKMLKDYCGEKKPLNGQIISAVGLVFVAIIEGKNSSLEKKGLHYSVIENKQIELCEKYNIIVDERIRECIMKLIDENINVPKSKYENICTMFMWKSDRVLQDTIIGMAYLIQLQFIEKI